MGTKKPILKAVTDYLAQTPKEEVMAAWEETRHLAGIGPTFDEYFDMETRTVKQVKVYMVTAYDSKHFEDVILLASYKRIPHETFVDIEAGNDDCDLTLFKFDYKWMEKSEAEKLVSKFRDDHPKI